LLRPGLEALRDLAAAGHIEAALVHSPDRLSRKYAYQVLLAEELSRYGVELVFLKAPSGATPEDQLLLQFQGMIAEYERAQIAERSRRGKRHRAQQGSINVLSGAPYGYRYVRKSDTAAAYYEVLEPEAAVVRLVFEAYTQQGLSINAIARLLNERQIPTRTAASRWERSTVWGMLRNPAYCGQACYGKTELCPRRRITRPLRQRGGLASRNSAGHERPRADWIEIPVPALVSEATFALAQEQLEQNKKHSPRRTIEPTLLQGMLVCERCGYGLYRTSTQTSARKLYYYRCLGSDAYRHLKGPVCENPPVRQDHLDAVVWAEVVRLMEEPQIIQDELSRRLEAARNANPLKQRQEQLQRDHHRLAKGMDRLLTAYQEGLLSLDQLRCRMPELRKQDEAVQAELQSLVSPLLANIYLHYVFDLWVDVWRRKCARGDVVVVRYADDNVLGFQHLADADRFLAEFRERLRKFGLELHPDKTRRIEFGRFAEQNRKQRGEGKPETFDFLGFTHISGKDRNGSYALKRKTISKRMRAKLLEIKQQLRRRMHEPIAQTGQWLRSIVQATSTTTRYRETPTVCPHSAIG
jgi:site-specific DNA recombinase